MKKRFVLVAVVLVLSSRALLSAQDMPGGQEGPNVKLELSCPRKEIVAGENVAFRLTLRNLSEADLEVSSLQSLAFLVPRVMSAGELVRPKLIKVKPGPSVTLAAGEALEAEVDLCTWFPRSLHSGSFQVSFLYGPNRGNRDVVVQSNVINLEVGPRTDDQEGAYQEFLAILRASGDEAVEKCKQFLAQRKGSMFDARVRLELAGRYLTKKEYEKVKEVFGSEFSQGSPTSVEVAFKHYLVGRSLRAQGKLAEAIPELEKTDARWAIHEVESWRRELQPRQD